MRELISVPAASRDAVGLRVDAYLADALPEISRSAVQKLLSEGAVLCGDRPAKKNDRVREGDAFSVYFDPPTPCEAMPEDIPIDVVYEDGDVIVVNKPQGMVVHPAPGNESGTLVNALLYRFAGELSGINGVIRPGIVHRIDKNTCGLLMVAKNDRAHQCLAAQIAAHSFLREYEAVCIGTPREGSGRIEKPIGRSRTDRKKMAVVPEGRHAATNYETLASYRGYSHIRCRLETGRTHQIRVHMASLGHPILGDDVYGAAKPPAPFAFLSGQVLCARRLGFAHPADGRWVELCAPLPPDFQRVLDVLARDFPD
ncbi:MAG: RluA family pseudouridine synthase [Clostridia bacterium]|nr:RluA family pseudouridine synthase [Clostridia bacterium]